MSTSRLPQLFDPIKFADNGRVLSGKLAVCLLPRLCEVVASEAGEVSVQLHCGRDEEERRWLHLQLDVALTLRCERCLQPLQSSVSTEVKLYPVLTEAQAQEMGDPADAVITRGEEIVFAEWIEDELLLSLPMFAKHDEADCLVKEAPQVEETDVTDVRQKQSPFAALAALKKEKD